MAGPPVEWRIKTEYLCPKNCNSFPHRRLSAGAQALAHQSFPIISQLIIIDLL